MTSYKLTDDFICRAATLDELLSDSFISSKQSIRDADLGAKRLAAWCKASSNSDWLLFNKRLERNNLSIYEVLTRFSTAKPIINNLDWVNWSQSVYDSFIWTKNCESTFKKRDGSIPFEDLFIPLLVFPNIIEDQFANQIFTTNFRICLENDLLLSLSNLTSDILLEKFNAYKKINSTTISNDKLYESFILYMFNEGIYILFKEKPVLLRLISVKVQQWKSTTEELIVRLINDFDEIRFFFKINSNARILSISNP